MGLIKPGPRLVPVTAGHGPGYTNARQLILSETLRFTFHLVALC